MAAGNPPFLVLSPALQTYAWGKKGHNSEACRLKSCGDPDFQVDETQTYAEVYIPAVLLERVRTRMYIVCACAYMLVTPAQLMRPLRIGVNIQALEAVFAA